jgi:hypothetical protein
MTRGDPPNILASVWIWKAGETLEKMPDCCCQLLKAE